MIEKTTVDLRVAGPGQARRKGYNLCGRSHQNGFDFREGRGSAVRGPVSGLGLKQTIVRSPGAPGAATRRRPRLP